MFNLSFDLSFSSIVVGLIPLSRFGTVPFDMFCSSLGIHSNLTLMTRGKIYYFAFILALFFSFLAVSYRLVFRFIGLFFFL